MWHAHESRVVERFVSWNAIQIFDFLLLRGKELVIARLFSDFSFSGESSGKVMFLLINRRIHDIFTVILHIHV